MLSAIRRFIDGFILTDHEWKKKHCPTLHWLLFEASDEEQSAAFEKIRQRADENYRDMLLAAGHSMEVSTRHMKPKQ